ncbi:hypothetical protein NKR23_g5162 [Pleurostoma richardsiae]|uniref:60S ribosomal subunit assembly/export protein LOC1 n=1 Tax=Pleurostoma richardsiae TaxID=41990 RepID=A0AA38RHK9_9PEZI|nr:hypothetical protein NKR23_g5162 [Pleurostoma richardsiae]
MGVSRTKTVKNKHAAGKSGVKGSKASKNPQSDPVVKSKRPKGKTPPVQIKGRSNLLDILKKRKRKTYSEKDLGIPELNMVTPIGVQKPKGKKKGKVFVDDKESMNTILALVQAEKDGQIESKMIKARQMEEIREARRIEAEKKEAERSSKLEATKDSLRKKRKRTKHSEDGDDVKEFTSAGTKASKPKKKVSFA